MIYAKLMSTGPGSMPCILSRRVDCGLLTPCTSRRGKCAAENIGMRPKEARDERIARACSYVRAPAPCMPSPDVRKRLITIYEYSVGQPQPRRLYCSFFAFSSFMRGESFEPPTGAARPPPANNGSPEECNQSARRETSLALAAAFGTVNAVQDARSRGMQNLHNNLFPDLFPPSALLPNTHWTRRKTRARTTTAANKRGIGTGCPTGLQRDFSSIPLLGISVIVD
ncbi:hypothetical protein DBV15_05119 [Temnothorax longispinosus]|uniref:Uncharacterized protein n=1 Tax=Temnothorax longispinosus TaxID=300112 RepID=A0A4V3SBN7_9HYME|nr:hypothetical protein DBV15_05119 [Temnothorax longispinosus]